MRSSAVEPSALGPPVARRAGAFAGLCLTVIACGTGPEPPSATERESVALDPVAYEEEIHEWRRARYERLTAPDGWLSLVGLFPLDADELTFGTGAAVDLAFGGSDEERTLGTLVFERDGASYRLDALESGDRLFVIFADRTTGDETYGGGRYLYTDLPNPSGSVVVDFNEAYNPPCVFTPYATCSLPPPQNRLDTAVTAGEKMVVGYLEH